MKKRSKLWCGVLFLMLILTGCGVSGKPAVNVKKESQRILQKKETIWVQSGTVNAKVNGSGQLVDAKYTKLNSSVTTPDVMITHHNQRDSGYNTVSYQDVEKRFNQDTTGPTGYKRRMVSIQQINEALKAAKSGIKIKSYSDLTYFQFKGTRPLIQSDGYIASGNHLYVLELRYIYQTLNKVENIPVTEYTSSGFKAPAKQLKTTELEGRWLASDKSEDQIRVITNLGYQVNTSGTSAIVNRFKIQDLKPLTTDQVYTIGFIHAQELAAKFGYVMPKQTTLAGSDGTYTYLFLTQESMVRIGVGGVTMFRKTDTGVDTTQIPAENKKVFAAIDRQQNTLSALSVGPTGTHSYEIAMNDLDRLTDTISNDSTQYKFADVKGDLASIRDDY